MSTSIILRVWPMIEIIFISSINELGDLSQIPTFTLTSMHMAGTCCPINLVVSCLYCWGEGSFGEKKCFQSLLMVGVTEMFIFTLLFNSVANCSSPVGCSTVLPIVHLQLGVQQYCRLMINLLIIGCCVLWKKSTEGHQFRAFMLKQKYAKAIKLFYFLYFLLRQMFSPVFIYSASTLLHIHIVMSLLDIH